MTPNRPTRLGRPPASSSVETRQRILDVARTSFAELGYGVTTNKYVATNAAITTGALYHYFDSKLAIYLAVYEHVQVVVQTRLNDAIAHAEATFRASFTAVLEASHELNEHDPSLARFLGAARIDLARHDELRTRISVRPGEGLTIIGQLVAIGLASGEIRPDQVSLVTAWLRTVFVGLVAAVSDDNREHRDAVDAIESVVDGTLLSPPK